MKISVQTGGIVPDCGDMEKGYRWIREAGFQALDWNIDKAWNSAKVAKKQLEHCIFEDSLEEIQNYYAEELAIIRKNGLELFQAHAPAPAYVKDFPEFNDYAIRIYQQCIRFCGSIGLRRLVIHGISLMVDDKTQTPESIREMNLHLFESLIPTLLETDVVVCLENLPAGNYQGHIMEGICSEPEEAIWYIDHLNEKAGKECFGLCLDTGHLNLLGKNQAVYIHKLGKRIKALHLHDNRGALDDHLMPYTGNIIWKDVIGALRDVGYEGTLNFETFKQVRPPKVDEQAVPILLRTICEIGEMFRGWMES